MNVECDHKADALSIALQSKKERVWKSREVEPGVVLDLNRKHQIIGIEILDASRRFKPADIFEFSVKHLVDTVPA